jgi:SAM-dependent methyltransferase
MNSESYKFVEQELPAESVVGKSILEVGSLNVNGTVRDYLLSLQPESYLGVDIEEGNCVDEVCNAENLVERYGETHFDIVVTTEMMEHVFDWRKVISNLKRVCKKNGIIIITTRSEGFPYHGFPADFWRFSILDFAVIFDDCNILALKKDLAEPGVFVKVQKINGFNEKSLASYNLKRILHYEK